MVIDRASIFADRFKGNPQILQAAVLGQSPVPGLDPYTALRAMQLLKESQQMQMAMTARQPTESPSLVQTAMQMPQMPPQMPQGAPQPQAAPQGMASGGLAALPSGSHNYAPGGIVAFSGEGEEGQVTNSEPGDGSPGFPIQFAKAQAGFDAIMQRILADPQVQRMNPAQRKQFIANYIKEVQEGGGESPYGAMRKDIAEARAAGAKNMDQAMGIALLRAAGKVVQPGGTVRGLAAAAEEFGGSYGQALQADKAEKRALANMEFQLADAERKERMGLHREARMSADAADRSAAEAARDARTRDIAAGNVYASMMRATRPSGTGAGKTPQPKFNEIAYQANLDNLLATQQPKEGETTAQFNARMRATAADITAKQIKTTDTGPVKAGLTTAAIFQRIDANVSKSMQAFDEDPRVAGDLGFQYQQLISKARKAEKVNNPADAKRFRAEAQILRDQYQTQQRALEARSMMEEAEQSNAANPAPAAPAARAARPAPPAGFVADPNR